MSDPQSRTDHVHYSFNAARVSECGRNTCQHRTMDWARWWVLNQGSRVLALSRPYWTMSDPPCVESDGRSDGLGPTMVLQRVAGDCWRQWSVLFERGYVAARGWPWKALNGPMPRVYESTIT